MSTFISAVQKSMEEQLSSALKECIQEELDHKILGEMLIYMGWHKIYIEQQPDIAAEWCTNNISNSFKRFGRYWYFQDAKDAAWFGLKWG